MQENSQNPTSPPSQSIYHQLTDISPSPLPDQNVKKNSEEEIRQQTDKEMEQKKSDSIHSLSKNQSKDSSENCDFSIRIEVSENLPELSLSFIEKPEAHYIVRIPMYNVSTFLKMQTQTYILDVEDPYSQEEYQIERRYSDFLQLNQAVFYNRPGYILSPFPDKNFQTFLKIKLGLGVQDPGERSEILEKRMAELQTYINNLAKHPSLCRCDELKVFLEKSPKVYLQLKSHIIDKMHENQSLQKISYVESLKETGRSLWSYFKKEKQKSSVLKVSKYNFEVIEVEQQIEKKLKDIKQMELDISKLFEIENRFSSYIALETQNDILQGVFAKINSSQEYCKTFRNHLQNILDETLFFKNEYLQAKKVIDYRTKLLEVVNHQNFDKMPAMHQQKLWNRINKVQSVFLTEWLTFEDDHKHKLQEIIDRVHDKWKSHKKKMRSIWRHHEQNLKQ